MENANSYEYLEKIKIAVIENLKKTAPVPSVQMQDVPRHGLGLTDEEEAELDDLNEDENKDVRMTQRQWEKSIARQDEYEDSDDEDMAHANGVHKTNGRTRRSILDYRNPHAADMDMDSGMATPVRNGDGPTEEAQEADETMVDDDLADEPQTETADKDDEVTKEAAIIDDDDGDVDMDEAGDEPQETAIKSEDVDALPSPQLERRRTPVADTSRESPDAESPRENNKSAAASPPASANGDGPQAVEESVEVSDKMEMDARGGSKDADDEGSPSEAQRS